MRASDVGGTVCGPPLPRPLLLLHPPRPGPPRRRVHGPETRPEQGAHGAGRAAGGRPCTGRPRGGAPLRLRPGRLDERPRGGGAVCVAGRVRAGAHARGVGESGDCHPVSLVPHAVRGRLRRQSGAAARRVRVLRGSRAAGDQGAARAAVRGERGGRPGQAAAGLRAGPPIRQRRNSLPRVRSCWLHRRGCRRAGRGNTLVHPGRLACQACSSGGQHPAAAAVGGAGHDSGHILPGQCVACAVRRAPCIATHANTPQALDRWATTQPALSRS